jgi:eukaryotic-like serine/threonine-protein kinase
MKRIEESRIQQVLEEMLGSDRTPEEACAGDSELLQAVRSRWELMQRVGHRIDALFPPDRDALAAGELPSIDGYEMQCVLGRGGMGVVFKARQPKLNRLVALKTLLAGAYAGPHELARFRREAEAVGALRHPHIVQIYDVGELPSGPYFTMELVEGGSLAQTLQGHPLPPQQAAELIATLASAVQFAHKIGFMHRDLKPANILMAADGKPKISDFGLARPIDAGPEFTHTGVRIGTPNYMAPEQAAGKPSAIGAAVDIYALGAILYESLTGRPPFVGESAADTERKVMHEDPIAPSRLHPNIPRDLETICLKCLQKDPARRYASAQDLADDLHRFLDGKPVIARPIGMVERTCKWARRRPTVAALVAIVILFLTASTGVAAWLYHQETQRQEEAAGRRERAREFVETALKSAYKSARAERYGDANRILDEAGSRIAEADSDNLRKQLERAATDVKFAQAIAGLPGRLENPKPVEGYFVVGTTPNAWADGLARTFAEYGFDVNGDPDQLADRIRASPLPEQTIVGLDQWALAAHLLHERALQRKLLLIAKLADREPTWRDRFHDPAVWSDEVALRKLAKESLTTSKPTAHQLAITGRLLRSHGARDEEKSLLEQAVLQRPDDYLLRWELARALARSRRHRDSAAHLRAVIALWPQWSWAENQLGAALCLAGGADEISEGIAHFRRAVALEPGNTILRYNLAMALARGGRPDLAHSECARAIQDAPTDPWAYHALGKIFMSQNRFKEAVPMLEKAAAYRPDDKGAYFNLGVSLRALGKHEEALAQFRKIVKLQDTHFGARDASGQILLKLRRFEEAHAEFACIIRAYEAGQDSSENNLSDAAYSRACVGSVAALLGLGRFADAQLAAQHALELPTLDDLARQSVQHFLDLAKRLSPVEAKLAKGGAPDSADIATRRAWAQWLYEHKKAALAAAQAYEGLLAEKAPLTQPERIRAGFAAALAGFGLAADAATLSSDEKKAWRTKALVRLRAEQPKYVAAGNPLDAARIARNWQQDEELALVFSDAKIESLPAPERGEWRKLWSDITAVAALDPQATLQEARAFADRMQWAKSAAIYSKLLQNTANNDGEIWFEYAAVQLLAGDRDGFRQSCQHMLRTAERGNLRAFLAARACTLAPDSVTDSPAPGRLSAAELQFHRKEFWALTELGALQVRDKRAKQALPFLTQSLKAEPKPGTAVVNWLWLALAYHELGQQDEALRWFKKADAWLDVLGNEFPPRADALGLHRHNWLEALILRREAQSQLSPAAMK